MEKSETEKVGAIETKEQEKPSRGFWGFFLHPAFALLSLVLAVAGLIFGYYFYEAAKVYPQLVFYAHPVRATIVKAEQTSDIKTFYREREINTDVTVAQVAIWNEGNASIKKDRILKPITIFTENNAPILEATIRKSTRNEVTQLSLNQDELQKGRLSVSWSILEQNDGGVIQIIYAGDSQTKISLEGVIEGQKEIDKSTLSAKIKSPDEQYIETRNVKTIWSYLQSFAYIILSFAFLVITIKSLKKDFSIKPKIRRNILVILSTVLMLISLLLFFGSISVFYSDLTSKNLAPPFDLN